MVHWDVSPHEAENLRPLRKSTPYRTSLIFSCLETLEDLERIGIANDIPGEWFRDAIFREVTIV